MNRIVTASFVALLLVGMSLPLVIAKPSDDHRGARESMRAEHERPMKGLPGEKASNRSHRAADAFIISVSANGLSKDNVSYTITAEGRGLAKSRETNETVKALHGFASLNVTLKDANGTILKNGTLRVRLVAHQNETGAWHWGLVSVGKTPAGLPKLFVHGKNVTVSGDSLDLDGKGFAIAKIQDGDESKRLRLRLDVDAHVQKI